MMDRQELQVQLPIIYFHFLLVALVHYGLLLVPLPEWLQILRVSVQGDPEAWLDCGHKPGWGLQRDGHNWWRNLQQAPWSGSPMRTGASHSECVGQWTPDTFLSTPQTGLWFQTPWILEGSTPVGVDFGKGHRGCGNWTQPQNPKQGKRTMLA